MPPFLALALSLGLILALLTSERRMNQNVSHAVWIPSLWIFFIGTRLPSQWLDMGSWSLTDAGAYVEGSPFDQGVFLLLYAAGIAVLVRRRAPWGRIMAGNLWITAFLVYGLLSVAWSDFPWTALKRFTKVFEHVVMVLVILSEANPSQAIDAVFRRFLAVSVVLSVLFLKYYPEFGRAFDSWTGQPFNTGVTADKNALGHICLLGTIFYASSLLSGPHRRIGGVTKGRRLIDIGMLGAVFWLLDAANAKTALVCSVLGIVLVAILARTRLGRKPTAVLVTVISLAILAAILESAFQISEIGIAALDRNPTLTDRTYVWADVLAVPNNVLFGTGFESFWLGPRLELLWQKYWWHPNQAHNGYIETYINLGAVGVTLLLLMIASGFFRALQTLGSSDPFGPMRFALIVAIAIFNYTDATFKAVHILYFTFFLVSLSVGPPTPAVDAGGTRPAVGPGGVRPTRA